MARALLVPSKLKSWPTPWIVEADANEFLFPLFAHGWYLTPVRTEKPSIRAAALARRFNFTGTNSPTNFVNDVLQLTEREKHHPQTLSMTNWPKKSSVFICTTTHSALRPPTEDHLTLEARCLPGITLRDARFAALVSSLPSCNLESSSEDTGNPFMRWEEFDKTIRHWATPASSNFAHPCPACAGPHPLARCEERHGIPSPPCPSCGGPHWGIDCALRKLARLHNKSITHTKTQIRRAPLANTTAPKPPTTPCPNCGGAHWKIDCTRPQAPPGSLRRFEFDLPTPAVVERKS